MKLKELLKEAQYASTWSKNAAKKGYTLKVGNIELQSGGPNGLNTIVKNGKSWGTFEPDTDRGNTWILTPDYGKNAYVKSIDDIIKIVDTKMHAMTRENTLDSLKEIILNMKPYSKDVVKLCEAAIKIVEKFDVR
jgi:hypothetical protein